MLSYFTEHVCDYNFDLHINRNSELMPNWSFIMFPLSFIYFLFFFLQSQKWQRKYVNYGLKFIFFKKVKIS